MYGATLRQEKSRKIANATVTAGFRCAPEMRPATETPMVTASPHPMVMLVKPPCTTSPGVPLPNSTTMATTPLPSRIRINVPRNSAASSARREYFCTRWAFYHPAIAFVVRALYGPLKRAPGIHAAVERVHAHDPPPLQQQRRTGAGSFVWSTAKQDDIAVARYFVVARLQVFEGNAQSSRHGVHFAFESGPDVHHHDLFTGFQLDLQFRRRDARHRQLLEEAPALREFPTDPGGQQSHCQHRDGGSHSRRVISGLVELAAEDVAQPGDGADPDQRAESIEQDEPAKAHAGYGGQGCGDGVQSGHELGHQQGTAAVPLVSGLSLAHAGVRLERHAANKVQ